MGIFINLDIMPNKISEMEWESVYKESLELINAYPFMDKHIDRETYGCDWAYVKRTKEAMLPLRYDDKQLGWHTFGDTETMLSGESFVLIRDLQYYRNKSSGGDSCDDILCSLINYEMYEVDDYEPFSVDQVNIFDSKTQGMPFHIPILAIACLIESRFPHHAIVGGDISVGQMKKAIDWANKILEKPIQLTNRVHNVGLFQRIKTQVKDDFIALESFMGLSMETQDVAFGNFVREHMNPVTINTYFTEKFKQYKVEQFGFRSILEDYLNQGYSLEDACDICVLEPNGCRHDPVGFIETVLSLEWGKDTEDPIPLTINDPNSSEPDTVESLFGKTMLKMSGFQDPVETSISYEEMTAILQEKLGDICNVEQLLEEDQKKEEKTDNLLDEFESWFHEEVEKDGTHDDNTTYDIDGLDDLIKWKPGNKVHPLLEKSLQNVKDHVIESMKVNQEYYEGFQKLSDIERIRHLIESNRYFYIHKQSWDEIIKKINQSEMINKVLYILSIKADEMNTNKLCKALLNNLDLFKTYILSDG